MGAAQHFWTGHVVKTAWKRDPLRSQARPLAKNPSLTYVSSGLAAPALSGPTSRHFHSVSTEVGDSGPLGQTPGICQVE